MRESRVGTERFLLYWPSVQPDKGSFDWGRVDQLVGGLASHKIRPVPFVWGSPDCVAGNPAHPPLDSAPDRAAWRALLRAAVERYGRGGSYWSKDYREQFGAEAKPMPIRSWQIWNEPNLAHYFAPRPSVTRYARLLRISHNAIIGRNRKAQIILAGLVGLETPLAWDFLARLCRVHGIKREFDAALLHPYAFDLKQLRGEIKAFRAVMRHHGERRTPLWITELGWGSEASSCRHCAEWLNRGLKGQRRMLSGSFKMVLKHRHWGVKRLFWFDWRDPAPGTPGCGFCSSSGLLRHNRDPKPAYRAFKRFTRGG